MDHLFLKPRPRSRFHSKRLVRIAAPVKVDCYTRAMTPTDSPSPSWWVICLCAEWCGVCREWRDAFMQAAAAHPGLRFAWVDVEDEADAMGEIDIETFPTLLIACEEEALFLGSVQPSATQVGRLIASLRDNPVPAAGLPAGATALLHRLTASVLPKV